MVHSERRRAATPAEFRSILFDKIADETAVQQAEPAFFTDLNLDQIVMSVVTGRAEYNLEPFFYTPLHDADAVQYPGKMASLGVSSIAKLARGGKKPSATGGKDFLAAYKAAYGNPNPDPYAIYGYEAMQLGLKTITSIGASGDSKADVLKALFAIKDTSTVLGTFGFNKDGDTTLKSYGVYKVAANGVPVFFETLTPSKTVS